MKFEERRHIDFIYVIADRFTPTPMQALRWMKNSWIPVSLRHIWVNGNVIKEMVMAYQNEVMDLSEYIGKSEFATQRGSVTIDSIFADMKANGITIKSTAMV